MHFRIRDSLRRCARAATFTACVIAPACSPSGEDAFGRVRLALTSSSDGAQFELLEARFAIVGPDTTTLESEDEAGSFLSAVLPVGDYSVELEPGYRLMELAASGAQEVDAVLVSDNPQPFAILSEETTRVSFAFQTGSGAVSFGEGTLELGIEVEKLVSREVIFSEVMKNPTAVSDADGEWLELWNTGLDAVTLNGCRVLRDATALEIAGPLELAPGAFAVLANADAPGFTPDYVYSSVTLPNSAAFTLQLVCGEELLDSVTIDPATVANAAGASLSLDPDADSATGNDSAAAWCNATSAYSGADLGTPGAVNPSCAAE